MDVEVLIGRMLGADFLYAHGQIRETRPDSAENWTHLFWGYRRSNWRTERSDGICFVDSAAGSVTLHGTKVLEQAGVRHGPGFHLAERMLRPQYAPIWGRPGDDWRLKGPPVPMSDRVGRLDLVSTESEKVDGCIEVEMSTGRLETLETSAYHWHMEWYTEESEGPPDDHFEIAV